MQHNNITDNLDILFDVLPPQVAEAVHAANQNEKLLEIVLDLGRKPEARYTDRELILSDQEVTQGDIDLVVARIGEFDADNRAGMERTLHRISAIRNRRGHIVGLTCRVGRAVYGTIDIIEDIIAGGKSILMLGRPGVGKTTMLREAARVLAEGSEPGRPRRRVVIVDTSNEIGGDGDIPHPAVGRARRMQVRQPNLQHEVMIEAVENHNPEVIVIDEIGRELEAEAARTIAERGVQLIGTAHGNTLDNLLLNPTLSDLVGGIESVTLSDEEARRRGTQKTVLERRAPPTFDVLIEIQERERLIVHHDVAMSVDNLLRGRSVETELRYRDESGAVQCIMQQSVEPTAPRGRKERGRDTAGHELPMEREKRPAGRRQPIELEEEPEVAESISELALIPARTPRGALKTIRAFGYGIARGKLEEAAQRLRVPLTVVNDLDEADLVVTVKNYYKKRPKMISDAEKGGMPIYVLRSSTAIQIDNFITDVFGLTSEEVDPYSVAMRDVQDAISRVSTGARSVDLNPQPPHIRRMQHELIREAHLISHSYGREPYRRVRIFRE
ncbi:MAG TPA: R3H domain-containing nucleic acid-binding protein [Anaerolineae bacterium]|nr:R3H domain-containing nucleic acid-binding protein [Anaerolineae bacterium]